MDFPSAGYMDVDNNNQSGYARVSFFFGMLFFWIQVAK